MVVDFAQQSFDYLGPVYLSFYVQSPGTFALDCDSQYSLFISAGDSDPNQFQHDISFLSMTGSVGINSAHFDSLKNGYTVLVYINAIDEGANKLLSGQMKATFAASELSVVTY